MTDTLEAQPAAASEAPTSRRSRAQRRARRNRRIRIAAIATLVVVAAGTTAGAWMKYRDQAAARPTPRVEVSANEITKPATEVATTRPLSPANPLRLWIAGDSLAGALGPSLGEIAGKTGVVQPQFESRVSSGLASNGVVNWQQRATDEIARLNPEVIVFIIGTNDFPAGQDERALLEYEQKADAMMTLLAQNDRPVYWLGPPILRDTKMNRGVAAINQLFLRLAPKHPSITYIDTYKVFSTPDGKYAASLPDASGKVESVRAGDGVHFTDTGGDRLGSFVFDLIDDVWKVRAQAVPDQAKPVFETPGSSRVPVNQGRKTTPAPSPSRSNGSNGSGGAGSSQTTSAPTTTSKSTGTTARPPSSTSPATTAAPPSTTSKPPATSSTAAPGG